MMKTRNRPFKKQRGVSLIAAIFLLTGMSILGALLTRLLTVGVTESMQEWYASQALYAAESGISWRMYSGADPVVNQVVVPGQAWFTTATAAPTVVAGHTMLVITSTGFAGPNVGNILASREITVTLMLP